MLVVCPLKFFENGLENFVDGNRVFITEVTVYRSFLINVETLYGVAVDAFCLKL